VGRRRAYADEWNFVTDSIGDYQMISWIGGATPSAYHPCNSGTALCYDDPTISTDTILGLDNRAPGLPGTWTVQRVPEGGTTALFLFAGLACLTILPALHWRKES
jgi:hypothetical protein